jgi:hypothetical protein
LAMQVLLVALHGEGVVRLLLLDEEPGVIALAVQGIRGDRDAGQVVGRPQGIEAGDFMTLLAILSGVCGGGAEGVQPGGSAASGLRCAQPVGDAGDVAGKGGQDVLDMGLSHPAVAGTAQAVDPDVLGERGFDPGADRVAALPLLGGLVEAVARLDLMQRAGQQCDRAGIGGRVGALRPDGAGEAGGVVESDLDVLVSP